MYELTNLAIDTAQKIGVQYADVRIANYRQQILATEDHRVSQISDKDDIGFGVRVLVNGAWGFASSNDLNTEEIHRVTHLAKSIAQASATTLCQPVELVPEQPHQDIFTTPYSIDPFDVDIEQKVGLLLEITNALKQKSQVQKANALMDLRKTKRFFANTEGTQLESLVITTTARYQATAVGTGMAKTTI